MASKLGGSDRKSTRFAADRSSGYAGRGPPTAYPGTGLTFAAASRTAARSPGTRAEPLEQGTHKWHPLATVWQREATTAMAGAGE